jgi:hypothetical protein
VRDSELTWKRGGGFRRGMAMWGMEWQIVVWAKMNEEVVVELVCMGIRREGGEINSGF